MPQKTSTLPMQRESARLRLSNKNAVTLSTLTHHRPALASTCACERNPLASFKISDEGLSVVLVTFGKQSRHMLCVLWRTQVKFVLSQMPRHVCGACTWRGTA